MSDEKKVLIAGLVLVFIICLTCTIRTDEKGTRLLLENQGYTQIEITGWRPFMADRNDWYSTGFVATAPNGHRVSGAVTSGFFKGRTIRFD